MFFYSFLHTAGFFVYIHAGTIFKIDISDKKNSKT